MYQRANFRGHVGSRTPNLLIRSEMLYPIELHNRYWTANIGVFPEIPKISTTKNVSFFVCAGLSWYPSINLAKVKQKLAFGVLYLSLPAYLVHTI